MVLLQAFLKLNTFMTNIFSTKRRKISRLILIPQFYSAILGEHNLSFHNISYNTFSGGNNQHGYPRQAPLSWQPSKRKGINSSIQCTLLITYIMQNIIFLGPTSRFNNLKRSLMFPIPGSSS
jgi:hypothetical protein